MPRNWAGGLTQLLLALFLGEGTHIREETGMLPEDGARENGLWRMTPLTQRASC